MAAETVVGNLAVVLEARTAAFETQLAKAREHTKRLEATTREAGRAARAAAGGWGEFGAQLRGLIPVLSAGALVAFTRRTVEAADALEEAANVAGLSVRDYSALELAAAQAGLRQEQLSRAMRTFAQGASDAITKGSGPFAESLAKLEVSLKDATTGALLPMDRLLPRVAAELARVEDPMLKAGIAGDLFGARALDVINLLPQLAKGFDDAGLAADNMGVLVEESAVKALGRASDAIDRVLISARNAAINALGGAAERLAPSVDTLIAQTVRDIQTLEAALAGIRERSGLPARVFSRADVQARTRQEDEIGSPAAIERMRNQEAELERLTFLLAEYQRQKLEASAVDQAERITLDEILERRKAYMDGLEREREARRAVKEAAAEQLRQEAAADAARQKVRDAAFDLAGAQQASADAIAQELVESERLVNARRISLELYRETEAAIKAENVVKDAAIELDSERGRILFENARRAALNRSEIDALDRLEERSLTATEVIVSSTNSAMGAFSSTIAAALTGAEVRFDEFVRNVAASIAQLVIEQAILRAIVLPIFGALSPVTTVGAAKGAAFAGGRIVPFAAGGVVDRPSWFPMADGSRGVMAEAGRPEGILPLARTPSGDLGVRTVGGSGGGLVFAPQISVSVQQAPDTSASDTGAAVAGEIRRQVESSFRAMVKDQLRPGGSLNPLHR